MSEIRVKSTGTIKLFESDNTSHVTIASPASLSANRTITIPDADVNLTNIATNTAKTSNATHSGEVTGATALTIADNIVDEANLKVSNSAVNGYMLTAQSGNTGGLTWAAAPSGGLVYLGGSDTGSNTSQISVDNVFSATYKNYLVMVSKSTPATNKKLFFKFRDDTPADVTNNYMYNYTGILANNGNTTQRAEINQAGVQMTDEEVSNSSNKLGLKKTMWVQNPFSSSTFTNFHGTFNYVDGSTNNIGGYFGGTHESNSSIRGVTFYAGSGSINVTVKVYGVVDS